VKPSWQARVKQAVNPTITGRVINQVSASHDKRANEKGETQMGARVKEKAKSIGASASQIGREIQVSSASHHTGENQIAGASQGKYVDQ